MSGRAAWRKVNIQVLAIKSAYDDISTIYVRFTNLFFSIFRFFFHVIMRYA